MKIINSFFVLALYLFRPLNHFILGPSCCKFAISCTDYAIKELKERSLFSALWSICKRILSCNPFSSAYAD